MRHSRRNCFWRQSWSFCAHRRVGLNGFYSALETFGAQILERTAHISGDGMLRVDHARDFASLISKVDAALHQRYVLGYCTELQDYGQDRYVSVALNPHEVKSHLRIYRRSGPYPVEHCGPDPIQALSGRAGCLIPPENPVCEVG